METKSNTSRLLASSSTVVAICDFGGNIISEALDDDHPEWIFTIQRDGKLTTKMGRGGVVRRRAVGVDWSRK